MGISIRLNQDIFYRKYDNSYYVWSTYNQSVQTVNEMAFDIISNLTKSYMQDDELIDKLASIYDLTTEDIQCILDFLYELERMNIVTIKEDNIRQGFPGDLSNEIVRLTAENHLLYQVMIELTYDCNERCKHCYVETFDKKQKLTTSEIFNIIDQLNEMNVADVAFSGGDVFTRPDTLDILQYAVDSNLMVTVFTNGIALTDDMIERMSKMGLKCVHFSIYGSNAETHDGITGVHGSFQKTMHSLKNFKALGTPVNMKVVLIKDNIQEYDNIMNMAQALGITTQVSTSIRPTMIGDKRPTFLRADLEDIKYVMQQEEIKHPEDKNVSINLKPQTICNAGFNSLTINPYGEVFLCISFGKSLGDLRTEKLENIWHHSPILKKWRQYRFKDIEKCSTCDLLQYCNFCPSQAYLENGGNWHKAYDEACKLAALQKTILNH